MQKHTHQLPLDYATASITLMNPYTDLHPSSLFPFFPSPPPLASPLLNNRSNKPKPHPPRSKPNSKTSNPPFRTSKMLAPSTSLLSTTLLPLVPRSVAPSMRWLRRVNGLLPVTMRSSETFRLSKPNCSMALCFRCRAKQSKAEQSKAKQGKARGK